MGRLDLSWVWKEAKEGWPAVLLEEIEWRGWKMKEQIEIYIRHSGERNLLMFYVPEEKMEQFIQGIKAGRFEDETVNINFEMTVRPEWRSKAYPDHVRLEVNAISASIGV
jgi:hypothetical protein